MSKLLHLVLLFSLLLHSIHTITQDSDDLAILFGNTQAPSNSTVTVGIVDDHHHVLRFWEEAVREGKIPRDGIGLPLIHVDSHGDGSSPVDDFPYKRVNETTDIDIDALLSQCSIADFIPTAQYMRMIQSRVVWIKPDWPNQQYNLNEGEYDVLLGTSKPKNQSFSICYRALKNTSRSFRRDFFERSPPCTRNLFPVHWDVFNLTSTMQKLQLSNKKYVLDIDEDFFATQDPEIDFYLRKKRYEVYFALLEKLVEPNRVFCDVKKNRKQINNLLHRIFWGNFIFLPGSKVPIRKPKSWKLKQWEKLFCKPNEVYEHLEKISKFALAMITELKFEPLEFAAMRKNHKLPNIMCKGNGYFGLCEDKIPFHHSTKQEILENMKKLKALIEKLGDPTVVTIARSVDGFTPTFLHPFIEENLLKILDSSIKAPLKIKYEENLRKTSLNLNVNKYEASEEEIQKLRDRILSLSKQQMIEKYKKRNKILRQVFLISSYVAKKDLDMFDLIEQRDEDYEKLMAYVKRKLKQMEKSRLKRKQRKVQKKKIKQQRKKPAKPKKQA